MVEAAAEERRGERLAAAGDLKVRTVRISFSGPNSVLSQSELALGVASMSRRVYMQGAALPRGEVCRALVLASTAPAVSFQDVKKILAQTR